MARADWTLVFVALVLIAFVAAQKNATTPKPEATTPASPLTTMGVSNYLIVIHEIN